MNPRTKTLSAALGSAVVLASGAYAIGSQSGDGSATARTAGASAGQDRTAFDRGPGPRARRRGLADLAARLHVDQDKLQKALKELRAEGQGQDGPAAALADALGLDVAKVRQALAKLRRGRHDRRDERADDFVQSVAKTLGLQPSKVGAAFDRLERGHRMGGPGRRADRRRALAGVAKELGVSETKLRAALRAARPDHGPGDEHAAELAKALGVSEDKLRAALPKLRQAGEKKRSEFISKLAAKLGIPEARVRAALPGPPRGGGRWHREGPGEHRFGDPGGPPPGLGPDGPPHGGPDGPPPPGFGPGGP